MSLRSGKGRVRAGVSATREFPGARVVLERRGKPVFKRTVDLSPAAPFVHECALPAEAEETTLRLRVLDRDGRELIAYAPKPRAKSRPADPATEPAEPSEVVGSDELFLTGLHLDQYRHATRSPVPYWQEALRRDPGDWGCVSVQYALNTKLCTCVPIISAGAIMAEPTHRFPSMFPAQATAC